MALTNESVTFPSSGFADGVEFEETFPEASVETAPAPAQAPAPMQAAAPPPVREPAPRLTVVRSEPAADKSESHFQEQLERRLREAEALVKQTIDSVRLEEEKRLAEWVRTRREEEERRLAKWADERRTAVERSVEKNSTTADNVVQRIEAMLIGWQERFEGRLDQRRMDDQRLAERQRITDEERLRAWRGELEHALARRFPGSEGAAAADRDTPSRTTLRDTIAAATNTREVGRILRDGLAEHAHTSAFALALHKDDRDEVAYRYRVATDDEVGTLLRRDTLEDGPQSAAAHMDGWSRAHRTVRAGTRNATVHTAQLAIRAGDATIGVLTLQTEAEPITDGALARASELVTLAAPRLAELRDPGSFRGA